MNSADSQRVQSFLGKWLGSEGNERANYQTFFGDLCVALAVDAPPPKGSVEGDRYCFDKNIKFFSEKAETTRFADFYKEGHFLIEAKQPPKLPSSTAAKPPKSSLPQSNNKNGQPPPKLSSPPSATSCAPAAANGQHYKLPTNLPGKTSIG